MQLNLTSIRPSHIQPNPSNNINGQHIQVGLNNQKLNNLREDHCQLKE
jgi:hypothetical protein